MTRRRALPLLRMLLPATSLVLAWGLAELAAWMVLPVAAPEPSEEGLYAVEDDPALGYRLMANHEHVAVKKKVDGSACYRATYRTDAFHRRDVGVRARPGRPHLLLFGCSVTMGEGLDDGDTLAHALAEALPDVNVVNYAVHGWGPPHALAKLESGRLPEEVQSPRGSAVYVLIPAHVSRTIGDTRTPWLFDSPHYRIAADGSVTGGDSLRRSRPWRTAIQEGFLAAKRHSWLLTGLKAELPLRHGEADWALTASVLATARERYRAQFEGEFFVAFHPTWDLAVAGNREVRDRLRALLEERGVPVLDHAKEGSSPGEVIDPDCDWHPTGALNRAFADSLADDLLRRAPAATLPPPGTLVLVYHRVGAAPDAADAETVSLARFEEQMRELRDRGYRTLGLSEMLARVGDRSGKVDPAEKTVVLTMDDGWKSQSLALPLLRSLGMRASFAIFPGSGLGWDYFEWPDVEAISSDPLFEVFSHSMTHPWDRRENLVTWIDGRSAIHGAADADRELFESKRVLEERLREPVEFFAWPRGWYNDALVARATAAGYRGLLTIEPGTNAAGDEPRFLKRVMVDGRCGLQQFREILDFHRYPACSPEHEALEHGSTP
jgi:peptidoglycan/xylan/chitin deacetylase (PgdA/CDA1 family)